MLSDVRFAPSPQLACHDLDSRNDLEVVYIHVQHRRGTLTLIGMVVRHSDGCIYGKGYMVCIST
jgi:hypothetical protein